MRDQQKCALRSKLRRASSIAAYLLRMPCHFQLYSCPLQSLLLLLQTH